MKKNIFLLSYPRSGNTFTRYILEYLTGMSSYGYMSNFHKKISFFHQRNCQKILSY